MTVPSAAIGRYDVFMIDLTDFEHEHRSHHHYKRELAQLQERLEHILAAYVVHERRAVIMFEGWDTAGKGGIIQRLTAKWDQRDYEVLPNPAPTAE